MSVNYESISEESPLLNNVGINAPKSPLKINLFSSWKTHLRLAAGYLICVLASGPLSSFPTLQPLLTKAHSFAYLCKNNKYDCDAQEVLLSSIYTSAIGLSLVVFIVFGMLYDHLGPRKTGAYGAVGVAIGLTFLWIALLNQNMNFLLFVGFALADVMGKSKVFFFLKVCHIFLKVVEILFVCMDLFGITQSTKQS